MLLALVGCCCRWVAGRMPGLLLLARQSLLRRSTCACGSRQGDSTRSAAVGKGAPRLVPGDFEGEQNFLL